MLYLEIMSRFAKFTKFLGFDARTAQADMHKKSWKEIERDMLLSFEIKFPIYNLLQIYFVLSF